MTRRRKRYIHRASKMRKTSSRCKLHGGKLNSLENEKKRILASCKKEANAALRTHTIRQIRRQRCGKKASKMCVNEFNKLFTEKYINETCLPIYEKFTEMFDSTSAMSHTHDE